MRARIRNLGVLVTSLVLSLVAGEALLRAVVPLPLTRRLPEVRYDAHPVRRFTLRPGQTAFTYGQPATIDAAGFRTHGSDPAGAVETTIFALGDSFTFGLGVRDEDTWPARLEARLRYQAGPSLQVINGGTISYGVFQELDLLRSAGLAAAPRLVIHALYWNDFMNPEPAPPDAPSVVTAEGYLTWDGFNHRRGRGARSLSWALSRSALLFSMRQVGRQVLPSRRGGDAAYGRQYTAFIERGLSDEEWAPVERFYEDLLELGRERDFATFVVLLPVSDIVRRPGATAHPYAAAARRRLEARGIPYLDGFALWASNGYGSRHFLPQGADAHLDATGYRIVADALATELMTNAAIGEFLRPGVGSAP